MNKVVCIGRMIRPGNKVEYESITVGNTYILIGPAKYISNEIVIIDDLNLERSYKEFNFISEAESKRLKRKEKLKELGI